MSWRYDVGMTQGSIRRRSSCLLVVLGLMVGLAGCASHARVPGKAVIETRQRSDYVFVANEIIVASVDGNASFETSKSGFLDSDWIVKVDPGTHVIGVLRRHWGSLKGPLEQTCLFTLDAKAGHYYQIDGMYPQAPRMTVAVRDLTAEGSSVKFELPIHNCT